jgi:hypothetical protein
MVGSEMEVTKGRALVGSVSFYDGSFMPVVLLDLSREPELAERAERLFASPRFRRVTLHFEDGEVLVEAVQDLFHRKLEDLVVRFTPEDADDFDAFLGFLEFTRSWILVIRVPKKDLYCVISADTDEIMFRYTSRKQAVIRNFKDIP